ncbi:hypothetical protein ACM64Y_07315 [Novispirillum sp. DQ9]
MLRDVQREHCRRRPAGRAVALALCIGAAWSRSMRGRAIAPPK